MKKILIGADPYETRVAIVEDGVVVETYLERQNRRSFLGNVYKSRVDNVLPGMEAAFIDAGLAKNAFLYVDDIVIPGLEDKDRRKRRIQELIKPKQDLLVQVVKDPMGTKGARVTMDVSFAGRFLVFQPDGTGNGVSKRLEDAERERLRGLVKKLKPRNGGGVIVRTAARGAELPELERDLRLLEDQWEAIKARTAGARSPALVHQEPGLALEMVRDDLRHDVDEVVTDDPELYERIRAYVEMHSPEMLDRVKLHTAATPLLRRYQVEEAIRSTMHRRVDLPSGGYLLFDYAEAFTIVDVNTGRFVGKSRLEDTILKNNLEAAREVVRQLRLRDIGGMIVIDFIDMAAARNREAVIAELQTELKRDRSKVYLTSISPLGLVEMTRQNVTDGVREILTSACPTCSGEARVLSDESLAIENLRSLRRHARLSESAAFLVELHPRIAALMVGQGGKRLLELESATGKHFSLVGVDDVPVERCSVVREGTVGEVIEQARAVEPGQELEVVIQEPHMFQAADAVAFLDGGYRLAIAGAGPYLGETHRVRIEEVGRMEAIATLLSAKPVTEAEMLALVDVKTDVLEPDRRVMGRIDLEDRDRRGGRNRKPKKIDLSRDYDGPTVDQAADPIELIGEEDEQEAVTAAAGTEPEGEAAGTGRKRRRRGGRARGRNAAAEGVADADEAEESDAAEAEHEPDEDEAVELEAVELEDEEGEGDGEQGETDEDGEPKRRRRGRRGGRRHRLRRERAAGVVEEVAEGEAVATEPAAAEAAVEEDAEAGSPRRRRSRRTVRVTEAGEQPAVVEEADAPAAEAEPAAPKRRRSRKDAAADEAVAEVAEAPVEAEPAADAAAEEKPKRRRAPRKAAEAVADPAEAAVAVEEPPADEKPKRRRSPRKAAEPVVEAAAEAPVAEAVAEEKPARRTRTRKAAAPVEAEAAVEPAVEPAAPKPRRAPRRTAAKAEAAVVEPAVEAPAAAAAPGPKRRLPRKAAKAVADAAKAVADAVKPPTDGADS